MRGWRLIVLVISVICLGAALFTALYPPGFRGPIKTYVQLGELYVSREASLNPITVDPYFKAGLEYWGISVVDGGRVPVYTGSHWITHSRDENGNFAYSSILQGCKPYYWGCGNRSFTPVPATEKLYLSACFMKETRSIYRGDGFAGALVDLWFENFRGDALVIDLYLARDVRRDSGPIQSAGKGFIYAFTGRSEFGKTYHFNIVLTEAGNGELVCLDRLLLEPIVELAFKSFKLERSGWWLVSVDAGAEAHYSEIVVNLYMLEVGRVAE